MKSETAHPNMANAYSNYLENEILNADPVQQVKILYRLAISSVGEARKHLKAGAIRERSTSIAKAEAILHELLTSLNYDRGGQISRSLASLYVYMLARLIDANRLQADAPLAEVERLLSTLQEGWATLRMEPASAVA